MRYRNRKVSRVARIVSTVFVLSTTMAPGLPHTQSALQQAASLPSTRTPRATPTTSGNEDQEDHGKKAKKNDPSDASVQSPKLVVVLSKKNPLGSLKIGELRRVFLRRKTHWKDGSSITVYERSTDHKIRREFSKRVFGKSPAELKEYWMNLQLTRGLKPPKVLRSANLVKQYLRRVKGGIGYLYEHEVDDTVKVLRIVELDLE